MMPTDGFWNLDSTSCVMGLITSSCRRGDHPIGRTERSIHAYDSTYQFHRFVKTAVMLAVDRSGYWQIAVDQGTLCRIPGTSELQRRKVLSFYRKSSILPRFNSLQLASEPMTFECVTRRA